MAKNKLANEEYFDFDLVGIVSTVKEYKLVWHINKVTDWKLVKAPDITIEFSGNQKITVSNFEFEMEHLLVNLVKNRLVARPNQAFQYLLEELKQFDYLLKYRDETEQTSIKDVLSFLKDISVIEYAAILEPQLIRSRDNLIF